MTFSLVINLYTICQLSPVTKIGCWYFMFQACQRFTFRLHVCELSNETSGHFAAKRGMSSQNMTFFWPVPIITVDKPNQKLTTSLSWQKHKVSKSPYMYRRHVVNHFFKLLGLNTPKTRKNVTCNARGRMSVVTGDSFLCWVSSVWVTVGNGVDYTGELLSISRLTATLREHTASNSEMHIHHNISSLTSLYAGSTDVLQP